MARAASRRRAAWMPPWTMGKRAWGWYGAGSGKVVPGRGGRGGNVVVGGGPPARNRSSSATHRASHRTLRSLASRAVASSLCPGMT